MKIYSSILSLACCVALLSMSYAQPVFGAEAPDCAQIENARERLACFDTKFPRDPNKPNVIPRLQSHTPTSRSPSTPQTEANPTTNPGSSNNEKDSGGFVTGGMLDKRESLDITTTIEGIRSRDQQKMVFRLANEQIWMQSSPRNLPFKVGDEVTIKSGAIGGYIMRNSGGTSTRVQRIK